MSTSGYDKGFGGPGRERRPREPRPGAGTNRPSSSPQRSSQGRAAPTAHGAPDPRRPFNERNASVSHARRADPTRKPWADQAGRAAASCASFGFFVGMIFLVFQGNWAAPIVLPFLLGIGGYIVFWLGAKVLDTFRGL